MNTKRTLAQYEYDALDQLTKETRYTYSGNSTTPLHTTVVTYRIDCAGNIRLTETRVDNALTKTVAYSYTDDDWADKLTEISINGISETISYSSGGNPSNWVNGSVYSNLTWTQGRQLSSVQRGTATSNYAYDMNGVRTSKIADGKKHEYVTQNGRVIRETVTNSSSGAFLYALDFTYDESGHPLTMRRYLNANLSSYVTMHYICNLQGDVIKLVYGASNTVYAEYAYDAWGNITNISSTGDYAGINPLRYRGYYYDDETGWYYLQSRYYDPALGRFINADSYASTGQGFLGYNMFAYCGNNPSNLADYSGSMPANPYEEELGYVQAPKPNRQYGNTDEKSNYSSADSSKPLFGAGASQSITFDNGRSITPDWSPIVIRQGERTRQTVSVAGSTSANFYVYADEDLVNPVSSSSAGVVISLFDVELKVKVGLDDISVSGSYNTGNTSTGMSVKANITKMTVGIEGNSSVHSGNVTGTTYTNVSLNALYIIAAIGFLATGVWQPAPEFA